MAVRARARGAAVTASKVASSTPNFVGDGLEPKCRALFAEGERRLDHPRAAPFQGGGGVRPETAGGRRKRYSAPRPAHPRCGARGKTAGSDLCPFSTAGRRAWSSTTSGRATHKASARAPRVRGRTGTIEARQASSPWVKVVFDAATGNSSAPAHGARGSASDAPRARARSSFDHLGRARADEEQLLDIGATAEQTGDLAVKAHHLASAMPARSVSSRMACAEARLGKDHHAGRRYAAGARRCVTPRRGKERILHLAMQPR